MLSLKNNRIYLRAVEPEDLDLLYIWENDPEIWKVSDTLKPFSRFQIKQYIQNSNRDIFEEKQVRFMICLNSDDTAIGTIDLYDFEPYHLRAGIGILIGEKRFRKQGLAFEALQTAIQYSFEIIGLKQLYCTIDTTNIESINLFSGIGFIPAGTLKQWNRTAGIWNDEVFLQLINANFSV